MKTVVFLQLITITITTIFFATACVDPITTGREGDFEWMLWSEHGDYYVMMITKYHGSGGIVEIPAELNGTIIESIGESAFRGKNLTAIVIPDTLGGIGDRAFSNNNLKNVYIPDSVEGIGSGAFANNHLETIRMGYANWIGVGVFSNNPITSITVGEGIWLGNPFFGSRSGFEDAYEANGLAAGTYERANANSNSWSLVQ